MSVDYGTILTNLQFNCIYSKEVVSCVYFERAATVEMKERKKSESESESERARKKWLRITLCLTWATFSSQCDAITKSHFNILNRRQFLRFRYQIEEWAAIKNHWLYKPFEMYTLHWFRALAIRVEIYSQQNILNHEIATFEINRCALNWFNHLELAIQFALFRVWFHCISNAFGRRNGSREISYNEWIENHRN